VFADSSGFISAIDTKAVGSTVIYLGGGRRHHEDMIDPAVGVAKIASVGQQVDSGIPLAFIHAASESGWEQAAALLKSSFQIGPEHDSGLPVIYARVEGEQSHESA
jgi:thymidine phosphorylase